MYAKASLVSHESGRNFNKIQTRIYEEKNHARITKKQNQPRFGLHESCQKVRIFFFRQESCIEGMGKES